MRAQERRAVAREDRMGVIVGGLKKPTFRARAMDAAREVWQNTDERVGFGVLVAGGLFPDK